MEVFILNKNVDDLKKWFNSLNDTERREVLKFLYAGRGKVLTTEALYCGPNPQVITDGLHTGPAPAMAATQSSRCPTCGK